MPKFLILTVLLLHLNISALEVRSFYWGFDGTAHENSFNTLTLVIANDTPDVYDDYIAVADEYNKGAVTHRKLFLNRGQKKTVQFPCYIGSRSGNWILSWKGGRSIIPAPKSSGEADVYLSKGAFARNLPKGLKLFAANNFPATVSMTSGLETAVLDHNPDWTPLQREAFMDWLKKGGRLYILKNTNDEYPQFSSLMKELNLEESPKRFGAGLVIRRAESIRNFKLPSIKKVDPESVTEYDNDFIIQALRSIVKTDHNWALIYLLIFTYLAFIGPLNYIIGRKTRDWKLPNLFFLLTVIGFSVLFSIIGRRGYGEETKLSSFSFADHIDGENYDVKQWTNIFVTSGDKYYLSHPGSVNLYHAHSESVNLEAVSDMERNNFTADIPLFSSRGLLHRAKMKGQKFNAELTSKRQGRATVKVTSDQAIEKVWIVTDGELYKTSKSGDEYTSTSTPDSYNYDYYGNYYDRGGDPYLQIQQAFLRTINLSKSYQTSYIETEINKNVVQVIIKARSPETFHFKDGNVDGNEAGWTFYRLKLIEKAN